MLLERMFEPQKGMNPSRLNGEIQASDDRAVAVEAESDAVRDIHITHREVAPPRRHRPGVDEERRVEGPPGLPPLLGAQQQAVPIAEPELSIPAEILRATQRGLKVERHLVSRVGVGDDGFRAQREHAIPIRQRHVPLQADIHAPEVVGTEIPVIESGKRDTVAAAVVRVQRIVSPVERRQDIRFQEIRLRAKSWKRRRIGHVARRGKRLSVPLPMRGLRYDAPPPNSQNVAGRQRTERAALHVVEQVVGAIVFETAASDAEEVFLRELVVLAVDRDFDRGAPQIADVEPATRAHVAARAVGGARRSEVHAVRHVRIGLSRGERLVEADAELESRTGRGNRRRQGESPSTPLSASRGRIGCRTQ